MNNFMLFFAKRFIISVLIVVGLLWGINSLLSRSQTANTTAPAPEQTAAPPLHATAPEETPESFHAEESRSEVPAHMEDNAPETAPHTMDAPPQTDLHAIESSEEAIPHTEERLPEDLTHMGENAPEAAPHMMDAPSETDLHMAESNAEINPHAEESPPEVPAHMEDNAPETVPHMTGPPPESDLHMAEGNAELVPHTEESPPAADLHAAAPEAPPQTSPHAAEPEASPQAGLHDTPPAPAPAETESSPPPAEAEGHDSEPEVPLATGVAFVNAVIEPLDHELNHRFWGWRPNDIINVTDNVENYQRGVLEVTRRTVRILTERISRTGSTVAFNANLENSMNWLMVKSDTYWFPSAEEKYQEALDELELFKKTLETGKGAFYTRTDNLIPLLEVFEDLLGSCEENLVKKVEKDGSKVSFFKADDYFFYAKGVASTMHTILEAVEKDFGATIESRKGTDELLSALESLHHACEINPLIVLNSEPGSLFANHRANMAAPISHAKFYLGVLITTLST